MTTQTPSQPFVPLDNDPARSTDNRAAGPSELTDAKSQVFLLVACVVSLIFYVLRSDAVRDFIREVTRLVHKL